MMKHAVFKWRAVTGSSFFRFRSGEAVDIDLIDYH